MNSVVTRLFVRLDRQDKDFEDFRSEYREDRERDRKVAEAQETRMLALEQKNLVRDTRATIIGGLAASLVSIGLWIIDHLSGKSS